MALGEQLGDDGGVCSLLSYGIGICHYALIQHLFVCFNCVCPFLFFFSFFFL